MEEKLDKTAFANLTFEDADKNVAYWRKKTPSERLEAAYLLSLRVYGYNPKDPPRMDKTVFSRRKRVRNYSAKFNAREKGLK